MKPQTKGFDINKHKHFQTPMEYIAEIYDNKYHFTIEIISNLLDFKQQYIQVNFIDSLDTLYIDRINKIDIRSILRDYEYGVAPYLIPKQCLEAVKDLISRKDILNKRVLISKRSVLELILKTFKKELNHPEQGTILIDLDKTDLQLIFKHGLNSTRSAKEIFGFKHDTQLYRELVKTRHIKYIVPDPSGKNNTARYLFY